MAQFEIGVDEILSSLSKFERREVYDELSEEYAVNEGPRLSGERLTPSDEDLRQVLCDLWEKRNYLTPDQVNRLANLVSEPFIQ